MTACFSHSSASNPGEPNRYALRRSDCTQSLDTQIFLEAVEAGEVSVSLIADIRRRALECKVVCWVRTFPVELARGLLDLGVAGILPKTITGHLLVGMLRRIASSEQCVDETLFVSAPPAQVVKLTSRESQILSMVARESASNLPTPRRGARATPSLQPSPAGRSVS